MSEGGPETEEAAVGKSDSRTVFEDEIQKITGDVLYTVGLDTIQVNMGLLCNQLCSHCHLKAWPQRAEIMEWPVMELILEAVRKVRPALVDLIGGGCSGRACQIDSLQCRIGPFGL